LDIKIVETKVDEDTYAPTLVLAVKLDVEHMCSLLQEKGRDEVAFEIGDMFFEKLEQLL
jgi:hypothetical protein